MYIKEKKLSLDEERTDVNQESNEHPEDMEDLAKIIMSIQDGIHRNNTKDSNIIHNLPVNDGDDRLQSLDLATPEKKRKECSVKNNETCEVQTNKEGNNVPGENKEYEIEASVENGVNYLTIPPELGSVYVPNSKKRRNGIQMEGSLAEGFDKHQNIPQESVLEQGLLRTDSMTKNLEASIGEYEDQQRFREACAEDIGAETHYIPAEDEVILESHAEITKEDLIAAVPANGENQKLIDNSIRVKYEFTAKWKRNARKFMQRKKKIRLAKCFNLMERPGNEETTPAKYEGQSTETATGKMVFSNGLVVEELSSGPEKGKVATHGKLVKLHYTASLKENGHVFESTVGKPAFSFRLGDEEIIDGWNAGIEGMRVGDKRRLIIPPSMGFGDHAMDNFPPNSWLVYDIELVSCRR